MLPRTAPFREFDRITEHVFGTTARPVGAPMDAYRSGDEVVLHLDLPGVNRESIHLDVERDVLTIRAERHSPVPEGAERIASERPSGRHSRRVFLGDTLDSERISARYDAGVLTLRVPVAERAKPRRIEVTTGAPEPQLAN